MTLLNTINVGGTDFKVAGVAILGSCPTPAGSEVKVCTFTDDFELKAGDMLLVKFTYANTYGDGSTTYPKLQVNGTNYTMRRADGSYITAGEWDNNVTLTFLFDGTDFILPAGSLLLSTVDIVEAGNLHAVTSNAVAEALSYSTDEVNTGKKWIDGKDIYRKTFAFTNLTLSNSPTLIGTIDVAIDRVTKTEEIVRQPNVLAGSSQQAVYAEQNGNVYAYQNVSSNQTGWEVYYTIEYTKTTPST